MIYLTLKPRAVKMDVIEVQALVDTHVYHPRLGPVDKLNPLMKYRDVDFYQRYRFTKHGFQLLFEMVEPQLMSYRKRTNSPVPPTLQLAIALRFYATGAFQRMQGDWFGVHRSTVNKLIPKVTRAIASLAPDVIRYQASEATQEQFLQLCDIPGITGCVDGTFVMIQSVGGPMAEVFRSRKRFFAINVQIVCNLNLEILDMVAGYPGSAHDARVWSNSQLCWDLQDGDAKGMLLGDSAYPLRSFLMIPFTNPNTDARKRYNKQHVKGRNCVERTIGVMKRLFPCLKLGITLKLDKIPNVITACGVLHNLCRKFKEPEHTGDDDPPNGNDDPEDDIDQAAHLSGQAVRDRIVALF